MASVPTPPLAAGDRVQLRHLAHIADTKHRFGTVVRDGKADALVRFDEQPEAIRIDRWRLWPLDEEAKRGKGRQPLPPGGRKLPVNTTISSDVRAAQIASGRSVDDWLRAALVGAGLLILTRAGVIPALCSPRVRGKCI